MKFSAIYLCVAVAASVLLALFTFLQPGVSLAPGLDSSWAYGINYTFENNLVVGRDVYFTFGPLGFLEHTAPFNMVTFSTSSWFWYLCSIVTYTLILVLCREASANHWQWLLNLALGFTLIFLLSNHMQRLLMIVYSCAFLHWRTQQPTYLVVMAFASVVSLLIKFSYGTTALALYLPYVLANALRHNAWRHAVLPILLFVAIYLVCWLAIYGSLAGAAGYIKGGLEFSSGSISAMASNPDNNWWAISGFYAAFLAGTAIISMDHRKAWIAMPVCFLGPLFIWTKYAFGREDTGHLAYLMPFALYIGLLWMIAAQDLLRKIACAMAIVGCYFAWQEISITVGGTIDYKPQITFFKPDTFEARWNRKPTFDAIQAEVNRQLAPLTLDREITEVIGEKTVDIYPWETIISYPNKLNWTPRPVYQTYITYTPWLDAKNADFYASERAPEFIIWHYHSYQDIDNRYPFSSDPLTLQALLNHYQQLFCKEAFCLWQRSKHSRLTTLDTGSSVSAEWNTWIEVPAVPDADILRAHIKVDRTLAGKLNLALWKEGDIHIDYELKNGDTRSHALLIDNAVSGVWISPYITGHVTATQPDALDRKTLQQWLNAKPAEGYIEKVETTSQGISVTGWGLVPFKPTRHQQLSLLLFNEKHAYIAKAQNRARPGITEHFGKLGVVDLDTSGIQEVIDTGSMTEGKYRVAFVVENEGDRRIHLQAPALQVDVNAHAVATAHNVKAFRIRTGRDWAFQPAFTLKWDGQRFKEVSP